MEGQSLAVPGAPSTKPDAPREAPLWIGTAGFSYPDWEGPVYGGNVAPARRLARLSCFVDLFEANVSHYRIPSPGTAEHWLHETGHRPRFRFTAKVWRGFTHGPERATKADLAAMRAFLAALSADGRFLAALAQFPPSFRASSRTEAYVARLAAHLEGFPLAAEFRDASWDRDEVRAGLREAGIAWVAPDLPQGPRAIAPGAFVTAPLGYVRLHGRSAAWYEPGVGRDRRYDHLYSAGELAPWLERIARMRRDAARVVVVANNHFGGKAVVNALQLKAAAEGAPVEVPPSLLAAYPVLAAIAAAEPPPGSRPDGQ